MGSSSLVGGGGVRLLFGNLAEREHRNNTCGSFLSWIGCLHQDLLHDVVVVVELPLL